VIRQTLLTVILFVLSMAALSLLPFVTGDPELLQYVKEFEEDCTKYRKPEHGGCSNVCGGLLYVGKTDDIGKWQRDKNTLGFAVVTNNFPAPTMIIIDNVRWVSYSELEKRSLMYHELGHACLRLGHVDDYDDLMYPYAQMGFLLPSKWEGMLQGLFNRQGDF